MSDNSTTDFFDGVGTGVSAPSALLANRNDGVIGEIVEMFKRDYVPYENRKSREPAKRDDGSNVQQLVIIVQTTNRNWANVSKIPKVDPTDQESAEKPPSEDDGKRAIYVPENKNIQFAIGRAVSLAGVKPEAGGTLGVKVVELRDTGQGKPMKVHEAVYKAPSAASGFFGGGNDQAQSAPAADPAPAAPATPAPSEDPWATPGQPSAPANEPPF